MHPRSTQAIRLSRTRILSDRSFAPSDFLLSYPVFHSTDATFREQTNLTANTPNEQSLGSHGVRQILQFSIRN